MFLRYIVLKWTYQKMSIFYDQSRKYFFHSVQHLYDEIVFNCSVYTGIEFGLRMANRNEKYTYGT